MDAATNATLARVADWIVAAERVVALTGAGVSTGSGIPDYRGPDGVWTRDPDAERLSSLQAYLDDEDVRHEVWRRRAEHPAFTADPNPAHHALAELERRGHLTALITQNVDGLHQAAGSGTSAPRARGDDVVEVHGTVHEVVCLDCDERGPMPPALDRVRAGEPDPRCTICGGLLKSATISFGQSLDPAVLQRAHEAAMGAEVFLAVGSSLQVHPVALLPRTALEAGARLVVINAEPTPYDERADALVTGDAGTALGSLVVAVRART